MYRHILLPLDGSPIAEQVLPHVEALAKAFGSRVTVPRVSRPVGTVAGVPVATEEFWDEEEDAEAIPYLAAIESRLRAWGVDRRCARAHGQLGATIVAQANEQGADLVAMTTHGRSGILRIALGSVAEGVVRHAECAVLLVRARRSSRACPAVRSISMVDRQGGHRTMALTARRPCKQSIAPE